MPSAARKSPLRHWVWILPLLVLDFFIFRWLALRPGGCASPPPPPAPAAESTASLPAEPEPPPLPPPPVWQRMIPPTPQQDLLNPDTPGVLQPTASGRINSAKFGSVRTANRGGRLYPSFHEGVDIAAMKRDRKNVPQDSIFAVAEGRVAFVNSNPGRSNYGRYVVLEHKDPSLGEVTLRDGSVRTATVYTLYAHMASIHFGIRKGRAVSPGDVLGVMGHSSNSSIPLSRGHLHWEIGLMLNSRFERKSREEKMKPDFGNYHGHNLFGLDPLDFFAHQSSDPGLTMASYLAQLSPACEVILRGKYPNFFQRYPSLWKGKPYTGGPLLLAISESGIPLSGRNANAAEIKKLGNMRHAVSKVYPKTLGRNGKAYITQRKGQWKFTEKGRITTLWLQLILNGSTGSGKWGGDNTWQYRFPH